MRSVDHSKSANMHYSTLEIHNTMGNFLVALQFALLLVLAALAAPKVVRGDISVAAFVLAGACLVLAVWTLAHNRPGNFNIRPVPKAHGHLITTGPYRWIRHPMYTSVLLGAAALAWTSSPLVGWATWLTLAAVLFVKSTLEERWMHEKHGGYAAYRLSSKRFLPWLF